MSNKYHLSLINCQLFTGYVPSAFRYHQPFLSCSHPGFCEPGPSPCPGPWLPLPRSYPGHSLLTEDLGVLLGEDDCPCGRKGKYFKVTGRVPRAEVRGCSDTYEG